MTDDEGGVRMVNDDVRTRDGADNTTTQANGSPSELLLPSAGGYEDEDEGSSEPLLPPADAHSGDHSCGRKVDSPPKRRQAPPNKRRKEQPLRQTGGVMKAAEDFFKDTEDTS
jgi:hypothetical protein